MLLHPLRNSLSDPFRVLCRRDGLVVAALWLALSVGCGSTEGPQRVAVSGAVTLDGKDLSSGVIRFIPTAVTQGPAACGVIQNGKYELSGQDGPVIGTHRVEIEATDYLGFAMDDEAAFAATIHQTRRPLAKNPVPEIYNRQSTLTADVALDGRREFSFELATKRKPAR